MTDTTQIAKRLTQQDSDRVERSLLETIEEMVEDRYYSHEQIQARYDAMILENTYDTVENRNLDSKIRRHFGSDCMHRDSDGAKKLMFQMADTIVTEPIEETRIESFGFEETWVDNSTLRIWS